MKLMKRMLRLATVLGAVGASLAVGVSDSHALLGLRIDYGNDGIFEFTAYDNGALDQFPFDSVLGWLDTGDSNGLITGTTNTGISKPVSGSATDPHLDLSTLIVATGAIDVKIQLSDIDFSGDPIGVGQLISIGGTITGLQTTSVTASIYRDLSNTQFGTGAGTLICSTGEMFRSAVPPAPDQFGNGCGNFMVLDDNYSVTVETIIHFTDAGVVSYDAHYRLGSRGEILDVPEPSSMMLLGFGVMGLGAWRRRRLARQD